MSLPKSITSLLTAIVVAIPAAITTLALNKPKPPKEIDAIIELDENNEVINEPEITPTPKPPEPPQESSSPNQGTPPASGSVPLPGGGGDQDSDDASLENTPSVNTLEDQISSQEEEEDVVTEEEPETKEDVDEQEEETDDNDEGENEEDDQVPGSEDSQKDPTLEELQKSIKEIMQRIIDEGKSFNPQNSNLYSLYTIKTGLETLPDLIKSLQTKMNEEKNKSDSEKGGSQGAQPSGEVSQ